MTIVWPIPIEDPEFYNPLLDKSRHPQFHAGYNFDPLNGDELNGAGTNEPIWPNYFDSFQAFRPLVMTDEMMSFFATACPDLVIGAPDNSVTFQREVRELALRIA